MKKRDVFSIISVLLIAIVLSVISKPHPAHIARIIVDGKLYATVLLSENKEISINSTNVAEVRDGKIFMKSATCPDKLCVHQGEISDSSKKIVCLPNKVIIEALANSDIDTVVK